MSREIIQNIRIKQNPEQIYRSLVTPSSIIHWWQAKSAIVIAEVEGLYIVCWGEDIDDPDFITVSKIAEIEPDEKLCLEYISYKSKFGKLPFDSTMSVQFVIKIINTGESDLEVIQSGIPSDEIADDYYNGCVSGWENVLNNIRTFCETK